MKTQDHGRLTSSPSHPATLSSHRWPFIVVALVTIAVFARVCGFDFSWWDDWQTIHHNPIFQQPPSVALKYYWTHFFYGLYIPITYTVWIGLAAVSKLDQADTAGITLNPWIYHSANVLVHVVSALLAYVLLRMLVKKELPACLGAILFAIHPVQVESVAWVSGMKDVLAGCLSLAALCRYVRRAQRDAADKGAADEKGTRAFSGVEKGTCGVEEGTWAFSDKGSRPLFCRPLFCGSLVPDGLGTLLFVAAMLSKPSASVVPFIAICIDRLIVTRSWRVVIRSSIVWILLTIPLAIVARLAQDVTLTERAPIWVRPFIVGDTLAFYLYKLLFPIQLGLEYGRRPTVLMHHAWFYFMWMVPAVIAFLVWRSRRAWLMAAAAIFVLAILPVSGLFVFEAQGYSTTADHYLYLAMIGPAMALAFALCEWRSRAARATVVIVLALFGFRAFVQTGVWRDDFALFRNAVAVNPTGFLSHHNLGCAYYSSGDYDDALIEFQKALALNPNYTLAAENAKNAQNAIEQRDAQEKLTPPNLTPPKLTPPPQSTQPSGR